MKEQVMFMDGLVREKEDGSIALLGSRCKTCGAHVYPVSEFCHSCFSEDVEEVELSTTGTLHTYTITRVPVQKFPAPHPLGLINLPEKVRIFAPLVYREDYEFGAEMELVKDVYWEEEDKIVVGYKFRQKEEQK